MPWWGWVLIGWLIFFIMLLLWCIFASRNRPDYLTDEEVQAQTAAMNEWKQKQDAKKARSRK